MIRMNNLSKICVVLLLAFSGCKEFIEPSIEDRKVVLLAPSNGTESTVYAQTFWWEQVEDALKYRLQVVSPNFSHPATLLLDTLVSLDKFSFTLDPGTYEWRVRAENGSSQTSYTSSAFVIYATEITEQQPQLQSPASGLVTAVGSATFSWLKLYGADEYRLEVDTNSFANESSLFLDQRTSNLEYNVSFTRDKVYQWRVKAIDGTTESKWSAIRTVTFDSTPPGKVVLSSPATGVSVSSPVTLRWDATATAAKYQLYVYKSNQTTAYSTTYPLTLTGTTHAFTGVVGETVYWQVRAIDGVGNTGAMSEMRSFVVQ